MSMFSSTISSLSSKFFTSSVSRLEDFILSNWCKDFRYFFSLGPFLRNAGYFPKVIKNVSNKVNVSDVFS